MNHAFWRRAQCLVWVFVFISATAHAYLDPGSGTILMQLLASVAVGFTLAFKRLRQVIMDIVLAPWHWIQSTLGRKDSSK